MTDRAQAVNQARALLAVRAPQTDDELHKYIKALMGFHVPRQVCCSEHSAPFHVLADLFFQRTARQLILANREGGKTRMLSLLHLLNGNHLPRCWSTSVGAVERQAKRCYSYVTRYFLEDHFADMLAKNPTLTETTWKNGSVLEILPGTLNAVNGPHPQRAAFDEVELTRWNVLQEFFNMPSQGDVGIPSQTVLISSRKKIYGPMQRLLREADARKFDVATWCVWEVMAPCPSCEKATCVLWERCQGRKHQQGDGFIPRDEVINRYLMLDTETWEAQQECTKPLRTGLVYQSFERNIHVAPCSYTPDWPLWMAFDAGYAHPRVVLFGQKAPNGHLFVFGEIVHIRHTIEETIDGVQAQLRDWGAVVQHGWGSPDDPEERDKMSAAICQTDSANNDVDARLATVRHLLSDPRGRATITIDPGCSRLIWEIEDGYHYPDAVVQTDSEPVPKSDRPVKENDDACDALGYLILGMQSPIPEPAAEAESLSATEMLRRAGLM